MKYFIETDGTREGTRILDFENGRTLTDPLLVEFNLSPSHLHVRVIEGYPARNHLPPHLDEWTPTAPLATPEAYFLEEPPPSSTGGEFSWVWEDLPIRTHLDIEDE